MLESYLPILVLIGIAFAFALAVVVLSRLVGPNKPNDIKLAPYECGMPLLSSAQDRFSIKFYIIAMLFILFDIEAVFLYPWAVMYRRLGVFGFVEMGVFIIILLVGFAYVWKKGALEWE
jgi:NADH-quinone oxidoreductase subunit A